MLWYAKRGSFSRDDVRDWKVGDRARANFSMDHIYGDPTPLSIQTSMRQSLGFLTEYRTSQPTYLPTLCIRCHRRTKFYLFIYLNSRVFFFWPSRPDFFQKKHRVGRITLYYKAFLMLTHFRRSSHFWTILRTKKDQRCRKSFSWVVEKYYPTWLSRCAALTAYNALNGATPFKGGDTVLIQGTGGV